MPLTLDAAPVDQIASQARQVKFWRTVLVVVTFVFFAVGWAAAQAWFAVVFCVFAVREGWQQAHAAQVTRGSGRAG